MLQNRKNENNYIGFFQARKLTIKWHLSESLIFQNLLKSRKLFPAEKFGNILAFNKVSKTKLLSVSLISADSFKIKIIYMMTLGLKFLLWLSRKLSDFKKASFRYYGFSVAINVFLWDCG